MFRDSLEVGTPRARRFVMRERRKKRRGGVGKNEKEVKKKSKISKKCKSDRKTNKFTPKIIKSKLLNCLTSKRGRFTLELLNTPIDHDYLHTQAETYPK